MPLESYTRSVNIAERFDSQTAERMIAIYQPALATPWDRMISNRFHGYITDLRLKVQIESVPESEIPNLDVTSTRMERLVAVRDVEWRSPRKQFDVFLKKSDRPLIHLASISLLNRNPYYQVPLLSYLSDSGIFSIGNDSVLYGKITNVGWGALFLNDEVTLFGAVKEEATILPTQGEQISYSQSFGWQIDSESGMILPPNANRLQLTLVNAGTNRIWLSYGPPLSWGRALR